MNAFIVFYYLLKCFIHYLLNKQNSPYRIAFSGLVRPHSFRIPGNHTSDYLVSLKYYKKALALAFKKEEKTVVNKNNHGIAIYESGTSLFHTSKTYVEKVLNKEIKLHLSKETLYFKGKFVEKTSIVLFATLLFLILFPITLFKKNKGIFGLILLEYTELVCLLIHLKKNKIKELYYFDASEKDANFTALVLQKIPVKVYKIPSEGSLGHYKQLITDVLCLTSAYQLDEIDVLKSKYEYLIGEIALWPPYFVFADKHVIYHEQVFDTKNKNMIGFLSSGSWRRKERNDLSTGNGYYESEEELILILKEFLQTHSEYRLFIYPHPCERSTPEIFEKAKKYYSSIFGHASILLPEINEVSRETFHRANIAVSVYSNSTFERLYCGFKSLFAPLHIDHFPINKQSAINNITAKSKEELFEKLIKNANISTEEFFYLNTLTNYRRL